MSINQIIKNLPVQSSLCKLVYVNSHEIDVQTYLLLSTHSVSIYLSTFVVGAGSDLGQPFRPRQNILQNDIFLYSFVFTVIYSNLPVNC